MLILEVPPPESFNWVDVQSSGSKHQASTRHSARFWAPANPPAATRGSAVAAGPPLGPQGPRNPTAFYLSGMLFKTNEAHRLLLLPLLSVSFPLLANLSFSHSHAKVTALCFPLPSLSIAVAAVADSCVTQAPEKPESPTRKVEAPDPSLYPAEPCPPGTSILLPACNGGLQVTYLSTPLWVVKLANVHQHDDFIAKQNLE